MLDAWVFEFLLGLVCLVSVCCDCMTIGPFIPTDSGVLRTVDPQKSAFWQGRGAPRLEELSQHGQSRASQH